MRLFFLEADRGTEGLKKIEEKQLGYFHYREVRDPEKPAQMLWQRYGPASDFRVLFVTTTTRRVDFLRKHLEGRPGAELMAFATLGLVKQEDVLFALVWRAGLDGTKRALVKKELG